jgi:hypothetical protein
MIVATSPGCSIKSTTPYCFLKQSQRDYLLSSDTDTAFHSSAPASTNNQKRSHMIVQQCENGPDRPEGVLRKYTGSKGMPMMSVKTPSFAWGSSPRAWAAALASRAPHIYAPEDGLRRPACEPEYT